MRCPLIAIVLCVFTFELPRRLAAMTYLAGTHMDPNRPREDVFSETAADARMALAFRDHPETKALLVDLTAEFSEPSVIRCSPSYHSFPILDGSAPTPEALRAAVVSLRLGRTFIHCAQSHGRTGLFALAVLLSSGAARSVGDGLRMLKAVRPAIRLSRDQQRCIEISAQNLG